MRDVVFKSEPGKSDAIVVSFHSQWKQALVDGELSAVIRRRVPKAQRPSWLYAYINSPVSQVACRAKIARIKHISLEEALRLTADLELTGPEIEAYFAKYETIGLYLLGEIQTARSPVSLIELRGAGNFSPPQSFLYLSDLGRQFIDSACNFRLPDGRCE